MHGTVARLSPDRGFGFIEATDGREFFFHRGALHGIEFEELASGVGVEFEVGHEPGDEVGEGPRATRVRPAADASPAADGEMLPSEKVDGRVGVPAFYTRDGRR